MSECYLLEESNSCLLLSQAGVAQTRFFLSAGFRLDFTVGSTERAWEVEGRLQGWRRKSVFPLCLLSYESGEHRGDVGSPGRLQGWRKKAVLPLCLLSCEEPSPMGGRAFSGWAQPLCSRVPFSSPVPTSRCSARGGVASESLKFKEQDCVPLLL